MKRKAKKPKFPDFITKGSTKGHGKGASAAKHRDIGDLGTPQLKLRHDVAIEVRERTTNGQPRTYGGRVRDQIPIDRHYNRHEFAPKPDSVMNAALYRAAIKLREDFYASGLMAGGKTVFERVPASSNADKAMTLHCDSLKAYNKAVLAISPSLRPVMCHVVCYDGIARDWAKANGHNHHAGLSMLKLALTDLAHYYKFLGQK